MGGELLEAQGAKPVGWVPQFHLEGLKKEDPMTGSVEKAQEGEYQEAWSPRT